MATDTKDDVDRLFSCFKCGVSPPHKLSLFIKKASVHYQTMGFRSKGPINSTAVKLKSGNRISPVVFYGSPQGIPVKKPTHLLRLLREIHLDLKKQNDLTPSKEIWVTFPRQEEAIRFSKAHAQTYVFSYQDHLTGQRRFLVSSYQ
ncbi:hypothetical protein LUZ60_002453 [Juncus effusus]|nr:hypothetical protein LUZ60_002453 [Juncus effusus]